MKKGVSQGQEFQFMWSMPWEKHQVTPVPCLKCPHCIGHHNVQLWPQKGEEQALIAAYSEGDSEDEETIKAWLDNKEWPGMNTLA